MSLNECYCIIHLPQSYDYLGPTRRPAAAKTTASDVKQQAINEERVAFCSILRAIEKLSVALDVECLYSSVSLIYGVDLGAGHLTSLADGCH